MLDRKNYESAIPQLEKKIDEIESGQKESVINYDAFREKTEKELKVVRSGIVDNNALIIEERERAIGVEETKADQTDLDDLSETVDEKADADSVYDKPTTDYFIDMLWANGINILDGSERILWDSTREVFLAPYSTSTATAGNGFRDGERLFYTSGGQDKYIIIDFPTLQEGRKYTLSMSVAKATSSTGSHTAYLIIDGTSYSFSGITSERWVDISATFTATSSSTFAKMRFGSASNTSDQATFIKHIKLEQGEASTDWTPSQLDASKTASNYIRYDEQNGLYVTDDTDLLENAVKIDSDSVDIVKGGQTIAEYSQGLTVWSDNGTEIAHLGYGSTQGQSGQTTSPYYDLGVRKVGTTKGSYSVAEGYLTEASKSYSHAEGSQTEASGYYSHAEGWGSTASGSCSHAEGSNTEARGEDSHAEGGHTTAIGVMSHAEGGETEARGDYSHAEGYGTIARGHFSHVQGEYNVEDSNYTYADIVGNGANIANQSNAYALDWSGNGFYKGDVYVGCKYDSTGGTKLIPFTKGTSDNSWIYTKYADGTFEAWRTYVTGSTALTNATNGAYSYANWTSISAPNLNSGGGTSTPTHVKATCRNGGRFASAYTSGTNVLFKVYACASVSTAQTYTVDLHIRGTWS